MRWIIVSRGRQSAKGSRHVDLGAAVVFFPKSEGFFFIIMFSALRKTEDR